MKEFEFISEDDDSEKRSRAARENEAAFRAILRDLKLRAPGLVPPRLNTKADVEELLKLFDDPIEYRGFGIGEFEVGPEDIDPKSKPWGSTFHWEILKENEAVIEIHECNALRVNNAILLYDITPKRKVTFKGFAQGDYKRS